MASRRPPQPEICVSFSSSSSPSSAAGHGGSGVEPPRVSSEHLREELRQAQQALDAEQLSFNDMEMQWHAERSLITGEMAEWRWALEQRTQENRDLELQLSEPR